MRKYKENNLQSECFTVSINRSQKQKTILKFTIINTKRTKQLIK